MPKRTGGFVPSYVHQNIVNSKSTSTAAQKAATETLEFDQTRAAAAGMQNRQCSGQKWTPPCDSTTRKRDTGTMEDLPTEREGKEEK